MTRRIVTTVLAALVCVACGVPTDRAPRTINNASVEYDLLAPSTTSTSTAPEQLRAATVFLLNGNNRLVGVTRQVDDPTSVGLALASLIQGATAGEQGQGYRSAVNQQTAVIGAEVNNGVAMIDVSDAFSGVGSQEQIFALAQVVYTATSISGVNSVQVLLNSNAVEVPRSDGTLTSSPLTRADYASLAPV